VPRSLVVSARESPIPLVSRPKPNCVCLPSVTVELPSFVESPRSFYRADVHLVYFFDSLQVSPHQVLRSEVVRLQTFLKLTQGGMRQPGQAENLHLDISATAWMSYHLSDESFGDVVNDDLSYHCLTKTLCCNPLVSNAKQ
jgi:hypothetical protein